MNTTMVRLIFDQPRLRTMPGVIVKLSRLTNGYSLAYFETRRNDFFARVSTADGRKGV